MVNLAEVTGIGEYTEEKRGEDLCIKSRMEKFS